MPRSRRAVLVFVAAASASALLASRPSQARQSTQPSAPASPPQENRPLFRAGVELVQLDVSVLDRDRRPVAGLTAADFQVFENGKPRPIRAFSAVRVPAQPAGGEPAASEAAPADVVTNRAGHEEGRLVVILMDRSIPPGQPTIAARRIATAAVQAMGPNDLGALVSSGGGVPQNLTFNRARLLEAIEQRDWSTGLSTAQEDVVGKQDPLSDGACLCGLCVLETVTRVADALQRAPRRHKMLLFIGSRVILQSGPRAPTADVGCERRLEDVRERMRASLALSHLTVHSVDPSGLNSIGPQARASAPGGKPGEDRFSRVQQLQVETMALLQDHDSLRYLPELTGGRTVVNTNDPDEQVTDIFAESAMYYVLAFEPAASGRSSAAAVEVKVSRPDARVLSQRKYDVQPARTAARGNDVSPPPPLLSALRGLLPVATRRLAMSAAAFAGQNTQATVVVNADVGAFADGEAAKSLKFALSAFDQNGRETKSATQTATVAFSASAETNVRTTLDLPAGNYEVRLAVEHEMSAALASVFAPITVPRFDAAPLSLSDVIVQASVAAPSAAPGESAPGPTTRRVFSRTEQIRAVLEVYQGTGSTAPIAAVSIRNRIVDSNGRAARDQRLDLAAKDFVDRRAALSIDMTSLPPGAYTLTIDASLDRRSATRSIPFAVR